MRRLTDRDEGVIGRRRYVLTQLRPRSRHLGSATLASPEARTSVTVSYFGGSRLIESMQPPRSVAVELGFFRETGRSDSPGLMVGLTESSPDLSLYVGWSLRLR